MKDVAADAGVSLQTVSNLVNGRLEQMSPPTQKRVQQAMRRLGYHPDYTAQSLRSARTRTLGFLVLDEHRAFLADPLTALLIAGVGDVARAHHFGILIQGARPQDAEDELFAPLRERRIDGAFVLLSGDPHLRQQYVERLQEVGREFVLFDEVISDSTLLSVRAAERDGGRQLTEHLLERGHRRIAFMAAGVPWAVVEQRFLGYCDALADADIARVPALERFEVHGYQPAGAAEVVPKLLALDEPPTAIICGSDLLALAAIRCIHDAGRQIPASVAVAGFDDFDFAALVEPALTTVAVPAYEMGRTAAQMLIQRLEGNDPQLRHAVFGVDLRVRAST
jgi:DNA-binding LacI/PurR family transcriptional regulator